MKNYNFPYLEDAAFLKYFDNLKLKEQFAKIVVLNFEEKPIQQIQGRITSGNFAKDGSSAMRRTGNLSLVTENYVNDLTDTKHLLSINKKVEVLIGFTNTTGKYEQYPILWFPQGVYAIIAPSISHSTGGTAISLTLHDKMAFLNGECGGTLPASIVFHEVEDIDENGNVIITHPTIYQIIQQLVNHFGGQQLGKIIISDVDSRIKQVMKWTGGSPLYLYTTIKNNQTSYQVSTTYRDVSKDPTTTLTTLTYGDDVGYIYTDFTYPGELIGNAGETVVSVLDKIKSVLGNYEYFYDIDGNFRFQQIKNYLNKSYSTFLLNEIKNDNYLVDFVNGKSVYTFDDANIITSYTNTPQYQQIKNDFVVWGKRTSMQGLEIPIRYHLAIDTKPAVGNSYKVFFYTDPQDKLTKAKRPTELSKLPDKGQVGIYYLVNNKIYIWEPATKSFTATDYKIETVKTKDFRTQLYLAGVANQPFGLDSNYYFTQLKNEWPKLYNVRGSNPGFLEEVIKQPSNIDFFLDFIDSTEAIAEFGVGNIGRRTTTIVDDHINCIFEPTIPNVVLIKAGAAQPSTLQQECENQQQDYINVDPVIYDKLAIGGSLRSAYEQIRKELYQYTNYNEQVSLTTLPIYYLEPNTRITIQDSESGIGGDYIIKSISVPLDINGTMNISCTKALERI